MKKLYLLLVTALFAAPLTMAGQEDNDDHDEDVITVTDEHGKKEELDVPEGMTYSLDSLLSQYNAKMYLQPDTTCHFKDENPSFDQEVYIDRLRRMPTIMEMPYNDIVQKFIDRYSGELRHSVSYMLGASNFYMPIFEQALETYNLPLELKYLPVIESALNPRAVSRVGATGLWQFMLSTGKRYGLEVNSLVDERRDPLKASYAAAHYLSDLYKIYGDWNLVIAAYNCGPQKLNKAIHRAKGKTDYWHIYPYLPRETRGYVPAFIAANYIMTYYCDHNICPMITELPAKSDTVVVNQDVHFEQISAILGISTDELEALNPQYRHDIVNGLTEPRALRLPASLIGPFIDHEDSIYNYKADEYLQKRTIVDVNDETVGRSHRSSSRSKARRTRRNRNTNEDSQDRTTDKPNDGSSDVNDNDDAEDASNASEQGAASEDTETESSEDVTTSLSTTSARRYRSTRRSASRSKSSNRNSHSSGRSQKSKKQKKDKQADRTQHVKIRKGDTLSEIAERNHTTVKKLKRLNGIKGTTIQPGKKLKIN